MRIGIFQSTPDDSACTDLLSAAVTKLGKCLAEAADVHCEIVLFPELFLGGYTAGSAFQLVAQCRNESAVLDTVAQLCGQYRVAAAVGYVERDSKEESLIYNSVIVFDAHGNEISNYRKCHLWSTYEKSHFSAGDKLGPVFELGGVRFGLLICYDVEFPEAVRCLRLEGAEVILVPTALANSFNALHTVPSRAFENQLWICYANYVGCSSVGTFCGLSVISGPDGTSLVRAQEASHRQDCCDEFLYTDVVPSSKEKSEAIARNPYIDDRRPELYRMLNLIHRP